MADVAFLTDSDSTSGTVYSGPAPQRREIGKVSPGSTRRSFIQRRFQHDSLLPLSRDDARPLVTKTNVFMCSGETVVGMVAFDDFSSVEAWGMESGQAVILGVGQAVFTRPAEGGMDSWIVPMWAQVARPQDRDKGIQESLEALSELTDQIRTLTPLPRSSALLSLAKKVKPSPKLSKKEMTEWARKLAKDISGPND